MYKVATLISRISNAFEIIILVLIAGYFVFLYYFGEFFSLPTFLTLNRVYILVLAIGSFVSLITLPVTKFSNIARFGILFLIIPFCCLFSYLAIEFPKQILDTANLDNHRYYITVEAELFKPHTIYKTYKCNLMGKGCVIINTGVSGASIEDVKLVPDETVNELRVFRQGYLIYIDGIQPHAILTSEELGEFIYYVGIYPDYHVSVTEQHTYMLFKCQTSFRSCQQLPFQYTDTSGSFELKSGSNTNELKVYKWKNSPSDVVLVYSYGAKPKCYVEKCTIPTP
jgi:hypothetical protein